MKGLDMTHRSRNARMTRILQEGLREAEASYAAALSARPGDAGLLPAPTQVERGTHADACRPAGASGVTTRATQGGGLAAGAAGGPTWLGSRNLRVGFAAAGLAGATLLVCLGNGASVRRGTRLSQPADIAAATPQFHLGAPPTPSGRPPHPVRRRSTATGIPAASPVAAAAAATGAPASLAATDRRAGALRNSRHGKDGAPEPARSGRLHPHAHQAATDAEFLNGEGSEWLAGWLADRPEERRQRSRGLNRDWGRVTDDFVEPEWPRLAGGNRSVLVGALLHAQREAAAVDPRLFRKVTQRQKRVALEAFCRDLERRTGVMFRASRGVQDEKVTILVKDLPARDVMRGVARLFGYIWTRHEQDGQYRYELTQTLRSQLVEEELRNQDLNEGLLALDEQMNEYRPYLNETPEQLRSRLATARGEERERLRKLVDGGGWGGLQLYARLSPAERAALRSGREFALEADSPAEGNRIPAAWTQPLLESWNVGVNLGTTNGREFWRGATPLSSAPGAQPSVRLRLTRSELGSLSLQSDLRVRIQVPGTQEFKSNGATTSLAAGRSPSVARPDNAAANAALRNRPPFQRRVSLAPTPICPLLPTAPQDLVEVDLPDFPKSGLTSAEVWEAVHDQTGLPVIADAYSRLRPAAAVARSGSLFDVLCEVSGVLGTRWRQDGGVLLCRSTSFFWDKLKEIPNRNLERWQAARDTHRGLPLEALLEMGRLSDVQLDSAVTEEAVLCLWGLRDYSLLGSAGLRGVVRFVSGLDARQQTKLLGADGLAFAELTPPQQQALLEGSGDPFLARLGRERPDEHPLRSTLLRAQYAPAGWRWWAPRDANGRLQVRDVLLIGPSVESVLAAARRRDPGVTPNQIRRSEGEFHLVGEVPGALRFGISRTHRFFHNLRGDFGPPLR